MQIRPFVAEALANRAGIHGWDGKESLDDPVTNIKIGVLYLRELKSRFQDLRLALAAYNRGPSEIANRLRAKAAIPQRYTNKVMTLYHVYREQDTSAAKLPPQVLRSLERSGKGSEDLSSG
ncbi:MAG: transglycosylase SLT domain-containing protein [Bacteroidota bacterium]